MSVILSDAFAAYQRMREDFELHRRATFTRAHAELRGELLGARGRAARIDPYSLFMGPQNRVEAYASDELQRWFAQHGRPTVEQFEAQWWSSHADQSAGAAVAPLRDIA
ncbi:hypothetical protein BH708_02505 [Brachybacterium sp. P6-10-X1]|uniref:hypothetical protein n=1 Tax=Brachybacterium sp. P6-10-X1 TaxID=1903186 RepID=UPI00097189AF|nr:hypothetical protein [Brachybacterium sp. P6-10-X1]APX31773.1 hypothetical protein BH708_02505 [Brachybacterium sp. P6-10-X1]